MCRQVGIRGHWMLEASLGQSTLPLQAAVFGLQAVYCLLQQPSIPLLAPGLLLHDSRQLTSPAMQVCA